MGHRGRVGAVIRTASGAAMASMVFAWLGAPPSYGATTHTASTTSASTNLIKNNCFVDPTLSGSWTGVAPSNSTTITDWTTGGPGGVQAINTYWAPSPGCTKSLYLGNTGNIAGTVSQTVSTKPGITYLLDWYMGSYGGPLSTMRALWSGAGVASQSLPTCETKSPCWTYGQVLVTATSTTTKVEFADVQASGGGAAIGSVSLSVAPTVNSFAATGLTGIYGSAEEQMLSKIPAHAVVKASAIPACALQAASANQVQGNGASRVQSGNTNGLELVWTISPTTQYVHEGAAARQTAAIAVDKYLIQLLTTSRNLYLGALQAERVPVPKAGGFINSWSIAVEADSTTGALMNFQITMTSAGTTATWGSVPDITSTSQAEAPAALANLLFYSQAVSAA